MTALSASGSIEEKCIEPGGEHKKAERCSRRHRGRRVGPVPPWVAHRCSRAAHWGHERNAAWADAEYAHASSKVCSVSANVASAAVQGGRQTDRGTTIPHAFARHE